MGEPKGSLFLVNWLICFFRCSWTTNGKTYESYLSLLPTDALLLPLGCLPREKPMHNPCAPPPQQSGTTAERLMWCTPVPKWKNAPADCGFSRWFIACFFIRKWLVNSPGQWVMKRFAAGRPIPVTTATVAVVPWKVCSKCAPSICCRC